MDAGFKKFAEIPQNKKEISNKIDREDREKIIHTHIEYLLMRYAEKINEGKHGIIFKLDTRFLPKDFLEQCQKEGLLPKEEEEISVIKLLKVYAPGQGKIEYDMQQYAHDAVSEIPEFEKNKFAIVPKPISFYDIAINPETQKLLELAGMNSQNRAEIILMDYVPGKDLERILYEEALKKINPEYVQEELEKIPLVELKREAYDGLIFNQGKGIKNRSSSSDEAITRELVLIRDYLKQNGFVLNPKILGQIKNTMEFFHKKGLCFRDGHLGNFMVVGNAGISDKNSEMSQTYIVDYGCAVNFKGNYVEQAEELYRPEVHGEIRKYLNDKFIVDILQPLTKTSKEEQKEQKLQFMQNLREKQEELKNDTEWLVFCKKTIAEIKNNKESNASEIDKVLDVGLKHFSSLPEELDKFIILAQVLISKKLVPASEIHRFLIKKIRNKAFNPRELNKLTPFMKILNNKKDASVIKNLKRRSFNKN